VAALLRHDALPYGGFKLADAPRAWYFPSFFSEADAAQFVAELPDEICSLPNDKEDRELLKVPIGSDRLRNKLVSQVASLWNADASQATHLHVWRSRPGSNGVEAHCDVYSDRPDGDEANQWVEGDGEYGMTAPHVTAVAYMTTAPSGTSRTVFPGSPDRLAVEAKAGSLLMFVNAKNWEADAALVAAHGVEPHPASAAADRVVVHVSINLGRARRAGVSALVAGRIVGATFSVNAESNSSELHSVRKTALEGAAMNETATADVTSLDPCSGCSCGARKILRSLLFSVAPEPSDCNYPVCCR